jgi:hypothetical protein
MSFVLDHVITHRDIELIHLAKLTGFLATSNEDLFGKYVATIKLTMKFA